MKKLYAILICLLLGAISCSDSLVEDVGADRSVYLSASIEKTSQTRMPYVPSTDADTDPDSPTDAHPLETAIWASTNSAIFEDGGNPGNLVGEYKVAYHTSANFKNGEKQRLKDIIYSNNGQRIYFVGLFPSTGWTTADGAKAEYTFTGTQDVMFADKRFGYYSPGASVVPNLLFHHLLTWLRIEVKAETEDVAHMWGPITQMKIRSKDKVSIGFDYTGVNWSEKIEFSESVAEKTLDVYKTDTDEAFPGSAYEIPYNAAAEVAYVMCAPVNAGSQETDYYLEITTQYRSATVPVNLMTAADTYLNGSTMGKQFKLSLTFKAGSNIAVAAAVTDWVTGGVSSGTIK